MNFRAFTLVELLVSIGIFTMMTALVVTKYGNFNQSVLLTNLAYDVALTIRTAQTYGLSVKNSGSSSSNFLHGYGVYFSTVPGSNQEIIFYKDTNDDGYYSSGETISTYAIKRGAIISKICLNAGGCTPTDAAIANIGFKRPDPDANICINNNSCNKSYIEIIIQGTDGSTRTVSVRKNGQISVKD